MRNNSPDLAQQVTLLDLLDRILQKGVIIQGDLTLAVADVDLVYVGLRLLLTSVDTAQKMRSAAYPLEPSRPSLAPKTPF